MAIKTHKVTLSLDNPRVIQSGINVQSFDKQSIQISIELTKNDEVFQVPSDATIRVSLLKLANQSQRIIVDVPNTNRDSIDWIVPDYLDGYQGAVRVGVYLSGVESVDLGYFTILSNVSDIDKMAEEFLKDVFNGWEGIEDELQSLNIAIDNANVALAEDLTQLDTIMTNVTTKNTQVNTLHSAFTTDVATKQADVTSKYNAFDESVTQANQTIDGILGLVDDVQEVSAQVAEKVQNFKIKNEVANGDFSNGTTGFLAEQATLAIVNGEGEITSNTVGGTAYGFTANNLTLFPNRKYYISYKIKPFRTHIPLFWVGVAVGVGKTVTTGVMTNVSSIFQPPTNRDRVTIYGNGGGTTDLIVGSKVSFDNIIIIDITSIFGAGNEPTKEEMDRLVAMVPNQWWDGELDLTQQQYVNWLLSFIREKANKTQEAWIQPTLANGTTGLAGNMPQYFKDQFGVVHLRGIAIQPTNGQFLFTLPVGYRPTTDLKIVVSGNNAFAILRISIGGQIYLASGNGAEISLDSTKFRAEG